MNPANKELLLNAANNIIESATTLHDGQPIGKEGMSNYSRFSASTHSFEVYTFMDPAFETFQPLKDFQEAVLAFDQCYVKLRYEINVEADRENGQVAFEKLKESYEQLRIDLAVA